MSVTNTNCTPELAAAGELRITMQGQVLLRGDDDYARVRKIWNGAVENKPALVAVCETSADVQAAVRLARRYGLPLSVRAMTGRRFVSGGFDFIFSALVFQSRDWLATCLRVLWVDDLLQRLDKQEQLI